MHTILAYNVTAGVNDSNVDMTAAVDPNFSRRNNHYILSEPYNLIGAQHVAASATLSRLNVPTINAIARHQIWGVNRSATQPNNPNIADYRSAPIPIPLNEEIAIEESNNLGAATENCNVFLVIAPPAWNYNIGRGIARVVARFTATIVVSASAWSADASLVFAENLKGGVYEVVGAEAQAAGLHAFRLNFVRMPLYNGARKLLPGSFGMEALGNQTWREGINAWGSWGKFHTFEPPLISCFSNSGGGTAIEGRLDLNYLGENASLSNF